MSSQDEPVRRCLRVVEALAVVVFLSSSMAASSPPPRAACSDPDLGERLKCKLGNVISQQEETANMLDQMADIPDAQKTAILSKKDRSRSAFDRSDPADFKQFAKKKNPGCQIAEDPNGSGDHDGICKGNEDCLEVIGDQIGDDVQPCRSKGKPSEREVCVQICDTEAVDSNPDNFDETGRGKDLEDELDDTVSQYEVLNQVLDQVLVLRAPRPISLSGGACDTTLAGRTGNGLLWASLGAKLVAETVENVSDKFCNQDVLGNNAATACAIVVIVSSVATDTWEVLDNIDGNRDSDGIDASYACLKEVSTSVGKGNGKVDAIDAKVDALDQQVKMLRQQMDELKLLLLTPQGKRGGFPTGK